MLRRLCFCWAGLCCGGVNMRDCAVLNAAFWGKVGTKRGL